MKPTISHSRPWILPQDIDAVNQALAEKAICHWQYAEELASSIAKYSGMTGCHLYSSGTLALRASLGLLKIPRKSAIGIPSFTCDGVLRGVIAAGYEPYIIDCDDYGLLNLDLALEACERGHIQACVIVHQFGLVNTRLESLCEYVPVIEDCSHVPPGQYLKNSFAVFGSLEGTKFIGGGEGGYLLQSEIITEVDLINAANILLGDRMSDLLSVLALCQIARIKENIENRSRIAKLYQEALWTQPINSEGRIVWFRFLIDLKNIKNVDFFINEASNSGITVRRPIMPHPLNGYFVEMQKSCPIAHRLWQQTVSLPIYPDMTDDDCAYCDKCDVWGLWDDMWYKRRRKFFLDKSITKINYWSDK
jgi:perosamine synthetase